MREEKIISMSKCKAKKQLVEVKTSIPNIFENLSSSTFHYIQLATIRHDIIDIILDIFYDMARLGEHIERINRNYNKAIDQYSVSFFFVKFQETVIVSWDTNVSIISIQSFIEEYRQPVGNIAVVVNIDKPPSIEKLAERDGSILIDIVFKHMKRHLSQYNPKEVIK